MVAGGPWPPLNRGANGDKGAPKLFACNLIYHEILNSSCKNRLSF